jgi:transcriptional regulator with XRE-family HTH domain
MAGLTQAGLAEATDLAVETVSRIERGAVSPSALVLLAIARACRTTIDTMLATKMPKAGEPEPVRRIVALLRGLDEEELAHVQRGLVAFLALRRGTARHRPASR